MTGAAHSQQRDAASGQSPSAQGVAPTATAETQSSTPTATRAPEQPPAPASATTITGGSAVITGGPRFSYFDSFLEPGNTSTFPGSADTATQDLNGYRTWLADHDMTLRLVLGATFTLNPLPTGQPREPQRYNGQGLTLNTSSQNFELSGKLTSIGLPHTWWFFGANNTFTSFYPNGPSSRYIRNLGIYQELLNGKLTIKAGITPNYYEYVGFFVGGSPILASGIPGLLPVAAGLGADPANVPLVNITAYGNKGSYLRVGVQRSTSVRGLPDEVLSRRNIGLNFTLRDAGPMYIGEVGIRRPASATGRQVWLRAGGFYNDSSYHRFDGRGTSANASLYVLGDRQITQPDKDAPARGVYLGGSAFWIPRQVNTSTQSYELRSYSIGTFPGRPRDTLTARVIYTKYSDDARAAQDRLGVFTNRDQINASLSYSTRATHGLYITPGVTYVRHPSFVGDFKDAIVLSVALFVIG